MSACNRCDYPTSEVALYLIANSGTGDDADAAVSWADAVAETEAGGDFGSVIALSSFPHLSGYRRKEIHEGGVYGFYTLAYRLRYQWRFYTPTCYFKIWWDEMVFDHPFPPFDFDDAISTEAKDYEWTPAGAGGFCVPEDFAANDSTTWPVSPVVEQVAIEPPTPTATWDEDTHTWTGVRETYRYFGRRNIRFSFVPGYTPPADGSANGFPVAG